MILLSTQHHCGPQQNHHLGQNQGHAAQSIGVEAAVDAADSGANTAAFPRQSGRGNLMEQKLLLVFF